VLKSGGFWVMTRAAGGGLSPIHGNCYHTYSRQDLPKLQKPASNYADTYEVDKIIETKRLRNIIRLGYMKRTSIGNTEYFYVCFPSSFTVTRLYQS
jgi:hypothetical protein